jgi:hypothetical protein
VRESCASLLVFILAEAARHRYKRITLDELFGYRSDDAFGAGRLAVLFLFATALT